MPANVSSVHPYHLQNLPKFAIMFETLLMMALGPFIRLGAEAYAAHPACLPSDGFTLAAYEHHSHTTVFYIYALPQLTRYAQSIPTCAKDMDDFLVTPKHIKCLESLV